MVVIAVLGTIPVFLNAEIYQQQPISGNDGYWFNPYFSILEGLKALK